MQFFEGEICEPWGDWLVVCVSLVLLSDEEEESVGEPPGENN